MEPTHLDLLDLTRSIRKAVIDDDTEQMHTLLCRLRSNLQTHVMSERQALTETPEAVRPVLVAGQQRLVDLLDEVLSDIDADSEDCRCVVRAVEIDLALRRQARLEAILFGPETSGQHERR